MAHREISKVWYGRGGCTVYAVLLCCVCLTCPLHSCPSLPPHLLIYSFTPSTVVPRLLTSILNCSLPYLLTYSSLIFVHSYLYLYSSPLHSTPLRSSLLHSSFLLSSHSISLQHEESSAAAMFCAPCIGMGWCQSQEWVLHTTLFCLCCVPFCPTFFYSTLLCFNDSFFCLLWLTYSAH